MQPPESPLASTYGGLVKKLVETGLCEVGCVVDWSSTCTRRGRRGLGNPCCFKNSGSLQVSLTPVSGCVGGGPLAVLVELLGLLRR